MKIVSDRDVSKVARFMMDNVKPQHWLRVARALVTIGEMFWTERAFDEPVDAPRSFWLDEEKSMTTYLDSSGPAHADANER
jgi:hypothetical protein